MTLTASPTRQQRYLTLALRHVTAVKNANDKTMADIYGGLCYTFPVLVRTCGLCQAIAFVEAKARSETRTPTARNSAYQHLRTHIKEQLGLQVGTQAGELASAVANTRVTTYMRYTRTVLQAWAYYKRFAASVLDVETAPVRNPDEEAHSPRVAGAVS